jgi:hypothetical protein
LTPSVGPSVGTIGNRASSWLRRVSPDFSPID